MAELFTIFDRNGSGFVDFEDMLCTLRQPMRQCRKDLVLKAFQKFDKGKWVYFHSPSLVFDNDFSTLEQIILERSRFPICGESTLPNTIQNSSAARWPRTRSLPSFSRLSRNQPRYVPRGRINIEFARSFLLLLRCYCGRKTDTLSMIRISKIKIHSSESDRFLYWNQGRQSLSM